MRNKTARVRFPIFNGFEVRVILARDVAATARRLQEDLSDAEAGWITHDTEPGKGWLVLKPDASPGIVSHEASHAIRSLFDYTGMGLDEEAFAYHLEHLVDKIHALMRR